MTLLRHVTAAVEVGALAVTTVSSVAHYRASVVHAPDFASAVHPVIDSHPVSLDRPHLAILTESRAAAVLHGNSLASCGLMAGVCSGISGFVPGCLTSLVATRLPGFVPAHLTSLGVSAAGAAAVYARSARSTTVRGGSSGSVIGARCSSPARLCARSTIVRATRRSRPRTIGASAGVLTGSPMRCARSRLARSSRVGRRRARLLFFRRRKCGHDEEDHQHGPFRGILS